MAVEITLKRKYRPVAGQPGGMVFLGKKQKGGHNNNRPKVKKPELPKGFREAAQEQTRQNQMVVGLNLRMKRVKMRQSHYEKAGPR